MDIFFWIVDLTIPGSMLLIWLLFSKAPPGEINDIYGYRTKRSRASQEAWDYAHEISGGIYLRMGIADAALTVMVKLAVPIEAEKLSIMLIAVNIILMFIPIIITEKKLKEKFGG